jgi:carbon monoxide dehydrogenase subunit G
VQAEPEAVWRSIFDPATVAAWVPGAREVAWVTDDTVAATVEQAVIGFKAVVELTVDVTARDRPSRLVLRGRGAEAMSQSRVEFELKLHLSSPAPGATVVEYETEAKIEGKLATVGDFLLRSRQRDLERQLVASLEQALAAPQGEER